MLPRKLKYLVVILESFLYTKGYRAITCNQNTYSFRLRISP